MLTQPETEQTIHTLDITRTAQIAAPVEITFESVLEELGPGSQLPDGTPFNMKIEPWPGGRWYRDLGDNAGHLWGHVQVIKPPSLLELSGPLFMSYPALSHVQYRLKEEKGGTLLTIHHTAMGLIPADHREGVGEGWEHAIQRIRQIAQQRTGR